MGFDFMIIDRIRQSNRKGGGELAEPIFRVVNTKDLMVKGGKFYALWNEKDGLWTTDFVKAISLIDEEIRKKADELGVAPALLQWTSNGMLDRFLKFCEKQMPDNFVPLNQKIIFLDTKTKKSDYASFKLPYALCDGPTDAWDELMDVLYSTDREKIEWGIGAIVSGAFKKLHKFYALEGSPMSGKSTVLNILMDMFDGYTATFSAKALATATDQYALSSFSNFPLLAFDHDADLSRVESNGRINALVAHEPLAVNEKFKGIYSSRFYTVLFLATNEPVQMNNAKTGLGRRLIVARPTNELIPNDPPEYRYDKLMEQVKFEYSAIAKKCMDFYISNPKLFVNYRDVESFVSTNIFYDFFDSKQLDYVKRDDYIPLADLWADFKVYKEESGIDWNITKLTFRREAQEYFKEFKARARVDDRYLRQVFHGFKVEMFSEKIGAFTSRNEINDNKETASDWLDLEEWTEFGSNKFNDICKDCPAQLAFVTEDGNEIPFMKWDKCNSVLADGLDVTKTHFVKVPIEHIVIDFDIRGADGEKSLDANLKAASKFPKTYAEVSKSGKGLHLHYIWKGGDPTKLSRVYDDNIEIKVFTGGSSLRRKLTKCNNLDISELSSGLPLKEENDVISDVVLKNERHLRAVVLKGLRKEVWPNTAPSVDLIVKAFDDAYTSGLDYDLSDMRSDIIAFAGSSSHQAMRCLKAVKDIHWKGKKQEEELTSGILMHEPDEVVGLGSDGKIEFRTADGFDLDKLKEREKGFIFFDVEVFPNLFVVVWKKRGSENKCVTWINPTPEQIRELCRNDLIGFNNRRYDNHILWGRMQGLSERGLYDLSQRIIGAEKGSKNSPMYHEAYKLAFTDIYDFASAVNKKSLKKFEVEMGINHVELGLPWDEPVDESLWQKVADYCCNDVISTEAVFDYIYSDYMARVILADIAGGNIYDTTNSLSGKLMFGLNRNPQGKFNYRNLADPVTYLSQDVSEFFKEHVPMMVEKPFVRDGKESILPFYEGYEYKLGVSTYRDVEVGEGGYVDSIPGIWWNVALLDATSLHPSTMIAECLFGPEYTTILHELLMARVYIKHKEYDKLSCVLGGRLARYVELIKTGVVRGKDLSNALKTVINSIYGLTSAKFPNLFKDPRNIDNIVAKRGALTMVDLKKAIEEQGYKVVHVKTDSVKIANADPKIVKFVQDFGKKYGYNFEFEAVYERMALVNKAIYICRFASPEFCEKNYGFVPEENADDGLKWAATGAQFAEPYVFKTLFSHEKIEFKDFIQTKSVQTRMEIDCNEGLGEGEHNYRFVGKEGAFVPVVDGVGGGELFRVGMKAVKGVDGDVENALSYDSVNGTKGFKWLESDVAASSGGIDIIDKRYYTQLVDSAVSTISEFGDFEEFVRC